MLETNHRQWFNDNAKDISVVSIENSFNFLQQYVINLQDMITLFLGNLKTMIKFVKVHLKEA